MSIHDDYTALLARHECTAYCTPDEHCDLVYSAGLLPGEARRRIDEAFLACYGRGVVVTRVRPAREAPSLENTLKHKTVDVLGCRSQDGQRWLVWWREWCPAE